MYDLIWVAIGWFALIGVFHLSRGEWSEPA
jgi:hypothetical protein